MAKDSPSFLNRVGRFMFGKHPEVQPTVRVSAPPAQRYSLLHIHASGGIGRVWKARDGQLGRDVALKELRPEQAADAVLSARFLKEAQITGQLEHPGIVPVYELSRHPDTGHSFYTMRFVHGRTLSDAARSFHRQRAAGKPDALEFLSLLSAFVVVGKTIAYAHSRGVIHRDLKGQNVMVGDYGEVVVLDWGLAKLVDQPDGVSGVRQVALDDSVLGDADLTLQGEALGTPAYMSPEQACGRLDLIDFRTDVYGLGAILYEILCGHPPFTGVDTAEVLRLVQTAPPPRPKQSWPDVPFTLERACLRALNKLPADRFASARELTEQVEQWQEIQRKQAEDALRTSEALYHSLVENIPIYVWRKDAAGVFTFVNKGFCDVLGKTREDFIGKNDFDVFPRELAEKFRRDDAHIVSTGETLRIVEEQVSAQGRRQVEVIKLPIYDQDGAIVGTQGVFWDVTDLKRSPI